MAFSTQKEFFPFKLLDNEISALINQNCKASKAIALKTYDSCCDIRAWAPKNSDHANFLSDIIRCNCELDMTEPEETIERIGDQEHVSFGQENLRELSNDTLIEEHLHLVRELEEKERTVDALNREVCQLRDGYNELFSDAMDSTPGNVRGPSPRAPVSGGRDRGECPNCKLNESRIKELESNLLELKKGNDDLESEVNKLKYEGVTFMTSQESDQGDDRMSELQSLRDADSELLKSLQKMKSKLEELLPQQSRTVAVNFNRNQVDVLEANASETLDEDDQSYGQPDQHCPTELLVQNEQLLKDINTLRYQFQQVIQREWDLSCKYEKLLENSRDSAKYEHQLHFAENAIKSYEDDIEGHLDEITMLREELEQKNELLMAAKHHVGLVESLENKMAQIHGQNALDVGQMVAAGTSCDYDDSLGELRRAVQYSIRLLQDGARESDNLKREFSQIKQQIEADKMMGVVLSNSEDQEVVAKLCLEIQQLQNSVEGREEENLRTAEENAQLRSKIRELEKAIVPADQADEGMELRRQIEQLNQTIAVKEGKYDISADENARLQSKIQEMEDVIAATDKSGRGSQLLLQIGQLNETLTEKEKENFTFADENARLRQQIKNLEESIAATANSDGGMQNSHLEQIIAEKEKENVIFSEENAKLRSQIQQWEETNAATDKPVEITELRGQIDQLNQTIAKKDAENINSANEIAKLRLKIQSLEKPIADAAEMGSVPDNSEASQLRLEIEQLKQSIEEKEKEKISYANENAKLLRDIKKVEETFEKAAKSENTDENSKLGEKVQQMDRTTANLDSANENIQHLEQTVEEMNRENDRFVDENTTLCLKIKELEETIASKSEEYSNLVAQNADLRLKIGGQADQISGQADQDSVRESIQSDLESSGGNPDENDGQRKHLKYLERTIAGKDKVIDGLRLDLNEKQDRIKTDGQQLTSLNEAIEALKDNVNTVTSEKGDLLKQIAGHQTKFEKKLETLKSEISKLKSEKDLLDTTLKELNIQIKELQLGNKRSEDSQKLVDQKHQKLDSNEDPVTMDNFQQKYDHVLIENSVLKAERDELTQNIERFNENIEQLKNDMNQRYKQLRLTEEKETQYEKKASPDNSRISYIESIYDLKITSLQKDHENQIATLKQENEVLQEVIDKLKQMPPSKETLFKTGKQKKATGKSIPGTDRCLSSEHLMISDDFKYNIPELIRICRLIILKRGLYCLNLDELRLVHNAAYFAALEKDPNRKLAKSIAVDLSNRKSRIEYLRNELAKSKKSLKKLAEPREYNIVINNPITITQSQMNRNTLEMYEPSKKKSNSKSARISLIEARTLNDNFTSE